MPASSKRPVLALLAEEQGVLAARSFPWRSCAGPRLGTKRSTSPVLDAGSPSRWGRSAGWESRGPGARRLFAPAAARPALPTSTEPLVRDPEGPREQTSPPPDRFLQVGLRLEPDLPTPLRIQSLQVGFSALPGPLAVHWVGARLRTLVGRPDLKWRLAQGDPSRVPAMWRSVRTGALPDFADQQSPLQSRDETLELNSSRFGDGTHRLRLAVWTPGPPLPGWRPSPERSCWPTPASHLLALQGRSGLPPRSDQPAGGGCSRGAHPPLLLGRVAARHACGRTFRFQPRRI